MKRTSAKLSAQKNVHACQWIKNKTVFSLITLIIVARLLCRLLGIYVYNANHCDADGNYSQVITTQWC